MMNIAKHTTFNLLCLLLIVGCGGNEKKQTLADIDLSNESNMQQNVFVKPKSEEEIKKAY